MRNSLAQFFDALFAGHGLPGPFTRTGIGLRPLATARQVPLMAGTAVAANVLQPGNIPGCRPTQRTFHEVIAIQEHGNPGNIIVVQLAGPALRVHIRLLTQTQSRRRAYALQITQRNMGGLIVRKVHPLNTRHSIDSQYRPASRGMLLALTLFMPRIDADHTNDAFALDELAFVANALNARTHFHHTPRIKALLQTAKIGTKVRAARGLFEKNDENFSSRARYRIPCAVSIINPGTTAYPSETLLCASVFHYLYF
jgi:hypothetical protein